MYLAWEINFKKKGVGSGFLYTLCVEINDADIKS